METREEKEREKKMMAVEAQWSKGAGPRMVKKMMSLHLTFPHCSTKSAYHLCSL